MGPGLTPGERTGMGAGTQTASEGASPATRVPTSSRYPEVLFENASAAVLLTVCVMPALSPQPRENAFVHSRSSYFQMKIGLER